VIELITGTGGVTVSVIEALFVGSCVDVAVTTTVIDVVVDGGVNSPLPVIVPALADHVTAEL
jgi:hypothetical protein